MIQQPRILQFFYKAPLFLLAIFGYCYAMYIIIYFREDTIKITNAGFVVMATMAALSFSFARVIESDKLKDRIMFAGERFLHSALLVLVASLLKYILIAMHKLPIFVKFPYADTFISFTVGILAGCIFANGVLFAHTGLRVLNNLLLLRFTRHEDWDDIW